MAEDKSENSTSVVKVADSDKPVAGECPSVSVRDPPEDPASNCEPVSLDNAKTKPELSSDSVQSESEKDFVPDRPSETGDATVEEPKKLGLVEQAPEQPALVAADQVDQATDKGSPGPKPPLEDESVTRVDAEEAKDSAQMGIVGPPTAVSELLNEEELRTSESTEQKAQDVVEWVQNSVKGDCQAIEKTDEAKKKVLREKRTRKKKNNELVIPTRKSQRIVSNIIKKSIKCLNKMHAMEGAAGTGKKVDAAEKPQDGSRASPKVPQSQQNGAALPEETATGPTASECLRTVAAAAAAIKKEPVSEPETEMAATPGLKGHVDDEPQQQQQQKARCGGQKPGQDGRKRKSTDRSVSANGTATAPKKLCLEQREQYISSLVGCEKVTAEELAARAEQLRAEVQALDELARAKEMEWNEILSMRKLKEEAYLRVERRRQVMGFMEGNGQIPEASLSLGPDLYQPNSGQQDLHASVKSDKCGYHHHHLKEDQADDAVQEAGFRKERQQKQQAHAQRQSTPPKPAAQTGENGRKHADALSPENRQIGEGRQGAIVDVRSIIADYRLRHPETVPRRGRRMRNSVNVGLAAGGAMVETGHTVDSRPSSTDSCKSNPNAVDPNNSMSFKDVLVQFAKLSQQQGEPVKTPQNYPDVTLHPVAPAPAPQAVGPQPTGSLLHGILTKSQSPRPTTFSPTLARLLTAPERERSGPGSAAMQTQQTAATQHLLQAYQGSNPVSISDLLSSSKARTEITITPVVNTPVQSHSNNLIHVDDVEEETAVIEDRESRISGGRDGREDRDTPPRCQGCHERAAQFVCAGCGNQWYCSRECQVAAWDEHSEVCSG